MRLCLLLVLMLALNLQVRALSTAGAAAPIGAAQWTDVPSYPRLVLIAGTATYFAPDLSSNYFYYDGTYWVYQGDEWYRCAWYNGPWAKVSPMAVPLPVLQIPVAYYNRPPAYFSGGQADAPPRWDMHWGPAWAHYRGVWDRPVRGAVAIPAPKPDYQQLYAGNRYPDAAQQLTLRTHYYPYRSHEPAADPPDYTSMNTSAGALVPGNTSPLGAPVPSHR